ncbi:MAG: DUF5681 domain-containing protein [Janthinobacterium lividum]
MTEALADAPRRPGKPFQKGQSGNPAGRRPGARSLLAELSQHRLNAEADAIVTAIITAAKAGDPTAMRLCAERLLPVRRGAPVVIDLPAIKVAADVPAAIAAVVAAVGSGDVSPEEGAAIAEVIEANRRAIETTDLESRLAALEAEKHGQ